MAIGWRPVEAFWVVGFSVHLDPANRWARDPSRAGEGTSAAWGGGLLTGAPVIVDEEAGGEPAVLRRGAARLAFEGREAPGRNDPSPLLNNPGDSRWLGRWTAGVEHICPGIVGHN